MEVSFSSELDEMENEGSAESEVDGEVEEDEDDEGDGGFIVEEAEEEEAYQARKRRRRRAMSSSSSSSSDGKLSDRENGKAEEANVNLNLNLRKRVKTAESTGSDESSSSDEETTQSSGKMEDYECTRGEDKGESSSSEESQQESGDESDEQKPSESSDELASDSGNDDSVTTEDKYKDTPGHLRWKKDLLTKAREAYDMRNKHGTSLRKLVYSDLPLDHGKENSDDTQKEEDEEEDEASKFGGLFQLAKKKQALSMNHRDDTSLPSIGHHVNLSCDWSDSQIVPTIKSLFITGSWGDQDAKTLLEEDEAMYGDFEDLETGEKHGDSGSEARRTGEGGAQEEDETAERKRLKKKKSLKAAFDVEYDDNEGGGYLEDLKREVSEQEERNRAEFEDLDEQTRVQYEGFRPGCYVRMELKGKHVS